MQTFNVTELADDRFLIEGTNRKGEHCQTILYSSLYNQIKDEEQTKAAAADMDASIQDFFAPLVAAGERLAQSKERQWDPDFTYVVEAPTKGTESKPGRMIPLDYSTVALRMIEEGDYSRLLWVTIGDRDEIEVLKLPEDAGQPVAEPQPIPVPFDFDELEWGKDVVTPQAQDEEAPF